MFGDLKGIMLMDYMSHTTTTGDTCAAELQNSEAIKEKC
jgi:hypothetical protein